MNKHAKQEPDHATGDSTGAASATSRGGRKKTSGGNASAGAAAKGKPARLHAYADVDVKSLGLSDLREGDVGHSWIALEWIDTTAIPDTLPSEHKTLLQAGGKFADPMGFWPDVFGAHGDAVGYSSNPFKSYVQGHMLHPDREHQKSVKAKESWDITQAQAEKVIQYADSKKGAQYSVYFYNCTTFAVEAVQQAGQSPPSASKAGICFPNAMYEGILANHKDGGHNTEVVDPSTNSLIPQGTVAKGSKKSGSGAGSGAGAAVGAGS